MGFVRERGHTQGNSPVLVLMCLGLGTIALTSLYQVSAYFSSSYGEVQRNVVKRDYRDLVNQIYTLHKEAGIACGCLYDNIFKGVDFKPSLLSSKQMPLDSLNVYEESTSGCTTNVALNLAHTSSATVPTGIPAGLEVGSIEIRDFKVSNEGAIRAWLHINPPNMVEKEPVPIEFYVDYDAVKQTYSYAGCSPRQLIVKGPAGPAQWNEYFESPKPLIRTGASRAAAQNPGVYYDNVKAVDQHPVYLLTQQFDNDTQTPCDVANGNFEYHCIHGGEVRYFDLPGYTSCNQMSVEDRSVDETGIFNWQCIPLPTLNKLRFITSAPFPAAFQNNLTPFLRLDQSPPFKSPKTKTLSSLVEEKSWKDLSVTVKVGSVVIAASKPGKWWSNWVEPLPTNSANPVTGACWPKSLTNQPAGSNPFGVVYTLNEDRENCPYRLGPPTVGLPKNMIDKISVVALRKKTVTELNPFDLQDQTTLANVLTEINAYNSKNPSAMVDPQDPQVIRRFFLLLQTRTYDPGATLSAIDIGKNLNTPAPTQVESQLSARTVEYGSQFKGSIAKNATAYLRSNLADFLWIELNIDAEKSQSGIPLNLSTGKYLTVSRSTCMNSRSNGINISNVDSSRFAEVQTLRNAGHGFQSSFAQKTQIYTMRAQDNGGDGVFFYPYFRSPEGLYLKNVEAVRNGGAGLRCPDCQYSFIEFGYFFKNADVGLDLSSAARGTAFLSLASPISVQNGAQGILISSEYLPATPIQNVDLMLGISSENGDAGLDLNRVEQSEINIRSMLNKTYGIVGREIKDTDLTSVQTFGHPFDGIFVENSSRLGISNVRSHSNSGSGILIKNGYQPNLLMTSTFNNAGAGLQIISGSSDAEIRMMLSTSNGTDGVTLSGPGHRLMFSTLVSNGWNGLRTLTDSVFRTEKITVHNAVLANNERNGLVLGYTSDSNLSRIAAADNGLIQLRIMINSGTPQPIRFRDKLLVQDGTSCTNWGPQTGLTGTCDPTGSSQFTKRTLPTLKDAFVGPKFSAPSSVLTLGKDYLKLNESTSAYPHTITNTSSFILSGVIGRSGTYGLSDSRGSCLGASCRYWEWMATNDPSNPLRNKAQNFDGNPDPCVVNGNDTLPYATGGDFLMDVLRLTMIEKNPATGSYVTLSHRIAPNFGWEQESRLGSDPYWNTRACTFVPGAITGITLYPKFQL